MNLKLKVVAILMLSMFAGKVLCQGIGISASALVEATLADRFEKQGGDSHTLWKKPWRIIILFNSAQSSFKSAYTNSVLENVRTFLTQRAQDGQPHRVWFYPYQLDLYTGNGESVKDAPLTIESIHQIEKVFPRSPFKTMADGVTPYPIRGGHNNIGARQQVSKIIAKSTIPTIILQFTDVVVGEAPGQDNDELVRGADQRPRGTEDAGLVVYDTKVALLESGVPTQKYSVLIYGPPELATKNGMSNFLVPILVVLGLVVLVAGGFFALKNLKIGGATGSKWSITLPNTSSVSLEKGKKVIVYGPGSKPGADETSVTLSGDDIPAAGLFELEWDRRGVKVNDRLWEVRVASADPETVLISDARLTCKDKTSGSSRFVNIKVNKI